MSIWKTRNLTLYGKIQLLKSLALPKLYYTFTKTNFSNAPINNITASIKSFLWNGKKAKIKYNTVIDDYLMGGLKVPDFESQLKAFQIKQFIRWKTKSNRNASTIFLSHYLELIGGAKQVYSNFNISRIPTDRISSYYKNILLNMGRVYQKQ